MKSLLIVFVCLSAQLALAEEHRPFSEMKGDCENFSKNLKGEFSLWAKTATPVAASQADKDLVSVGMSTKTSFALHPQASVKLIATPEKTFPAGTVAFAGMGQFDVASNGTYRVALGKKVWLDVIDLSTKQSVNAKSFEMQTGCTKIFKVVEFDLDSKKKYALQISSSPDKEIDVLISAVTQDIK